MFSGKNVVVTGCGSLGREIVTQLLEAKAKVACLDHSEQAFFKLELELGNSSLVRFFLRDIMKYDAVHSAIEDFKTDYVIHTVAKKFVNYIEDNPLLAINTNVYGTMNVLKACIRTVSVRGMLNVSTDKVCNPTSIYGLTKALSERLVSWANQTSDKVFASIRHPNFMPSDGSCFTIWQRQVAKGEPITITDERMRRWFIPIEEAARLTIEAFSCAQGGEVFVPAIAKEYKIIELAKKYGKNFKFIGKRPGERLSEQLMTEMEKKSAVLIRDLWRIQT